MEDKNFQYAVNKVLALEGGYVNDPQDPGGETKYGISTRTYPNLDIRSLTRDQAVEIYHRDFWLPNHYDRIQDPEVAAKIFDMAVNMGSRTANRLLQRACNRTRDAACDVGEDGVMGPITLEAVNLHPCPGWLLATLRLLAVEYHLGLRNPRFLAGWIKRDLA